MSMIDLTAPAADLGTRFVIEATTDPAERERIATDPEVVRIVERAAQLDSERRRRIHEAYWANFRTYRIRQMELRQRVRKAGGTSERHLRALNERLTELFGRLGDGDREVFWGFTCAVEDAVYAHLAGEHLSADEARLFAAPWVDVAGAVPA